jgi:hypothetical protein
MSMLSRARGATRFEFALCAGIWALLCGVLLYQVLRYQAEVEEAAVRLHVHYMRAALDNRVLQARIRGDLESLRPLAGSNPVNLLQSAPPDYRGEYDRPEQAAIPPGSWFFDRKQRILVYLSSGNKSFLVHRRARLAYRIELTRLPTQTAKPPGSPAPVTGVVLQELDG